MDQKERELFKTLCSFQSDRLDESLLQVATSEVLGKLFFNRMQAVAFGTIAKHGGLGMVNREFRDALKVAYEQNLARNNSYRWSVKYISGILSNCTCKYALLKGALLCFCYPEGYRTSSDIDILCLPEHVTEIGAKLQQAGFVQGNIRNGEFVPATRREIIESKMMRGETVPYIKELGLPGMKYLEVDINFSLDYKNGDTTCLKDILNRTRTKKIKGMEIVALADEDFFIHLCCHLYKEATTLPWVEMTRDMTLYKYCDIYLLLADMRQEDLQNVFARARELGMEKVCAFAIEQTAQLFLLDNPYAIEMAKAILREDPLFIHTIVSPKDKKTFIYTKKSVEDRFFAKDRKELLKEV